jgi:uncharacterized protein YbjT (DUF2867 family)
LPISSRRLRTPILSKIAVGSALVRRLLQKGQRVRVATRTPPEGRGDAGIDHVRCDLADALSLDAAFEGI